MKRKRIFLALGLLLAAFLAYKYIHKPHRNIGKEKAVYVAEAGNFYTSFKKDKNEFNANYLDKTVQLSGIVSSLESNAVVLNTNTYVTFTVTLLDTKLNDQITIKGRYVGYDDLLEQLKIDQAILLIE